VTPNGKIYLHETETYQLKKELDFEHSMKDNTNDMAITSDGKKLIIGFPSLNLIGVWDLKSHEMIHKILLEDGSRKNIDDVLFLRCNVEEFL
jgi:hypothetical protein